MTREELMKLPVGTVVYNGHTEGIIGYAYYEKVIEISISIEDMDNDNTERNERPSVWSVSH